MNDKCRKERLILFPGKLDGIFIRNELRVLSDAFEYVTAVSSRGNEKVFQQIYEKYGIQYKIVKSLSVASVLKSIYLAMTDPEIKEEIKRVLSGRKSVIVKCKRVLYLLYYVSYAINAEKIYSSLKDEKFDDILYSFWLSKTAYACACIRKKYPVRFTVSRAHGYDLYEERNETDYLPFRQYISMNTDKISFISEYGKSYYMNRYPVTKCELSVCYLGTWNPEGICKTIKDKDYICMVSCSSINSVKRLDRIIDILSEIQLPLRWIHIGDGSLRKQMEDYANEKLKDRFWFAGFMENKHMLEFYKENDVDFLINMSDSEGLPVSMMEAFSFGIPVIAADVGGISEIVDSDTGLLAGEASGVKDIEKISVEIEQFIRMRLTDVESYQRMSGCCVKKWQEKFHAETNYQYFAHHILSGQNCN